MSKQRALVTGGAGFIGSHLVENLLAGGYDVVVIDNFSTGRPGNLDFCRNQIDLIEADLAEPGEWMKTAADSDYVFHLAALADIVPSIENPLAYYQANVTATLNLLGSIRESSKIKKLVYAASSSCYGLAKEFPTTESAPIAPEYPYALTKRMGEELVLHFEQVYKIPSISLRFFNVYGTRSRTSGAYGAMFGVFLAQKLAGKPYTVVGDGEQKRDFIYVTDIARACIAAAESSRQGQIYNVGSQNPVSVNQVVDLLGGEKVYVDKRPGEPDLTYADISKIKNEFGWSPQVGIRDGVQKMLDQIDYWKEAPVWNPESIKEATASWFKYLSGREVQP